jgi:small subunit ribosomal protein S17
MKVIILNIIDSKTFKALASVSKKHFRYGKYISIHKKYMVDSGGADIKIGDEVEIVSSRPISKTKRWSLKVN